MMAKTPPLPSRYMQVERNDAHPLAWFTLDGKGWVPVDGLIPEGRLVDREAINYLALYDALKLRDDMLAWRKAVDAALGEV